MEAMREVEIRQEARFVLWALRCARGSCSLGWSMSVWHGPNCSGISNEEIVLLKALVETAERLRRRQPEPAFWWRSLVPADAVRAIDSYARSWLLALHRAGVDFPDQGELVTGLTPLENLVEPAGPVRLH